MALAEAGCDLVLNGRDASILARTVSEIPTSSVSPSPRSSADVSDPRSSATCCSAAPAPDILVNNNGGPKPRDFRELERDAIIAGVTQNMVTPIELIRAVIDGMAERGFGRIVNITSLSVYQPIRSRSFVGSARRPDGVPGWRRPHGRGAQRDDQQYPARQVRYGSDPHQHEFRRGAGRPAPKTMPSGPADIPAGRLGTPEEFGQACAFLASVHAGYITGQNLVLDGGVFNSAF